ERAVALHRLDYRPRPFRRTRLGRLHLLRRALPPDADPLAARSAVFDAARQPALLDRIARDRLLHHLDVGIGNPAGADVALLRQARLPRILLHRDRAGDAPVLSDPRLRRRAVPARRAYHGLQPMAYRTR